MNSKANASELRQNPGRNVFCAMLSTYSNIQSHTGVLPVMKGLKEVVKKMFPRY